MKKPDMDAVMPSKVQEVAQVIKKTVRLLLIIAIFCSVASVAYAEDTIQQKDIKDRIDRFIEENKASLAGLSFSVFTDNDVIYQNHFGFADISGNSKVDEDTVMDWGSVSKTLVWVSIMQLKEKGVLDLDADIDEYLPDGLIKRKYGDPVTIKNLMNHDAGFEEYLIDLMATNEDEIISLEEYLKRGQPEQIYRPGEVCAYSNYSSAIAAYIVERASGQPFYEYVRENIFDPLNMNDTSIKSDMSDNASVKERRKKLKSYTTDGKEKSVSLLYINPYPIGMCVSTIDDMRKFAQSLLCSDTPLFEKEETCCELFENTSVFGGSSIGRNSHGLWRITYCDGNVYGHGGNTLFCSSYLLVDPERKSGVVIQTNQRSETLFNTGIAQIVFGEAEWNNGYDGLALSARTVFRGPLRIYKLLNLSEINSSDKQELAYRNSINGTDKLSMSYGDHLVVGIKEIIADFAVIALYAAAVVISVIRLIKEIINKIKFGNSKSDCVSLLSGALVIIPFALLLSVGIRLTSYASLATEALAAAALIIFVSLLVTLVLLFRQLTAVFKNKKSGDLLNTMLLLVTVINTVYWQWCCFITF